MGWGLGRRGHFSFLLPEARVTSGPGRGKSVSGRRGRSIWGCGPPMAAKGWRWAQATGSVGGLGYRGGDGLSVLTGSSQLTLSRSTGSVTECPLTPYIQVAREEGTELLLRLKMGFPTLLLINNSQHLP